MLLLKGQSTPPRTSEKGENDGRTEKGGHQKKRTAATANDVATRVASHTKRPAERTEKKGNTAALRPFAMPNTVEGKKKKKCPEPCEKKKRKEKEKKRNRTEKKEAKKSTTAESVCESHVSIAVKQCSHSSAATVHAYRKKKKKRTCEHYKYVSEYILGVFRVQLPPQMRS